MALSKLKEFDRLKFFAINADLNEIKSFYHEETPVILVYSKRDFLNPLIYEGKATKKLVKAFLRSRKNVQAKKTVGTQFAHNEL